MLRFEKLKIRDMKDFALKLEGCSKADRKKVIKAAKSVGFKFWDGDRFKDDDFNYIRFTKNGMEYGLTCNTKRVKYTMPQDWNAIQEALGIEVEKQPQDGEAWATSKRNLIVRVGSGLKLDSNDQDCYSKICYDDSFDVINGFGYWSHYGWNKATPEEEKQLIESEHKNGYHWDGKDLVKIPEYVEAIKEGYLLTEGCIYKVKEASGRYLRVTTKSTTDGYLLGQHIKPSTIEAYEAQEAKNDDLDDTITSSILNGALDKVEALTTLNTNQVKRIKELEEEKVLLERALKDCESAYQSTASKYCHIKVEHDNALRLSHHYRNKYESLRDMFRK